MSDVTALQAVDVDHCDGGEASVSLAGLDAVDEQLIAQLAGRARAGWLAFDRRGRAARPADQAAGGVRAGG